MDAREELQSAAEKFARSVQAVEPPEVEDEDVGELEVSEYIILMFAFDTFVRYVEETTGVEDPGPDDSAVPKKYRAVIAKGMKILRMVERELADIRDFLDESLPGQGHKRMLAKAMRIRVTSAGAACWRSFQLNRVLSRGGATTLRAIFKTNRNILQIREAISAVDLSDGDAALDLFAAFVIKNARIRAWIDLAAQVAGSEPEAAIPVETIAEVSETADEIEEEVIPPPAPTEVEPSVRVGQDPIDQAAKETSDQGSKLLAQNVEVLAASGSDEAKEAEAQRKETLQQVEQEATEAARKALGDEGDKPLTRSETVGVAVAAATAAVSDPAKPTNIPTSLVDIANDPEQLAAALTDGKVLVTAGAGAGKTRTLVSRIAYLATERGILPSRILATSFNKKAGKELQGKVADRLGGDVASDMAIGTLNSLFRRGVMDHGTQEEKMMMSKRGFKKGGEAIARQVHKLWPICFPDAGTLKLKDAMLAVSTWHGNDVGVDQAKVLAAESGSRKEIAKAEWYRLYEGFKGALGPDWKPPCDDPEAKKTFNTFMARHRPGKLRLGDFDDQIAIFRNILQRKPAVRAEYQQNYDHILVDECQDLNAVQHEVISMMTEHITDGADGKSLWMVGDDKQSIYSFRGARPDLFTDLYEKEGWATRTISTNYRCEPEIVEHANTLIAHNEGQIPMEARPAPGKQRGRAQVSVKVPPDEMTAGITTIEGYKAAIEQEQPSEQDMTRFGAVLCRTNKELNAYETSCIVRGVPYARRGKGSFLGSPETSTVLGYASLATGADPKKMQKGFGNILNNPPRFFIRGVGPKEIAKAADLALGQYARAERIPKDQIDPRQALKTREFKNMFLENMYGEKGFRELDDWKLDKDLQKLSTLSDDLEDLQILAGDPERSTRDLFDSILSIETEQLSFDPDVGRSVRKPVSLRETIEQDIRDRLSSDDEVEVEGDDAADDEEEEHAGLGNIAFLYKLTEPDPTDPEDIDPNLPQGFKAKMERYAAKARELRTDLDQWYKTHLSPPPAIFLGTIHSVKGGQWKNVTVQMPKGKFPMEPHLVPGEPPPPPEEVQAKMEDERRLAYVALTRPKQNLTVMCPKVVGGKGAGVSRFVEEAGLHLPTDEAPEMKEAAWEPPDEDTGPWDADDFGEEV
jgi:DNA helicase-2/ATP-dependent DNA helicase PcrA